MDQTASSAEKLESLFPQIMRAMFRPVEDDPVSDLPLAQLRLLRALYGLTLSGTELCSELHVSASAFSQMAHRLEEAGLVAHQVDENDRRIKRYSLTEKGSEQMTRRRKARAANAEKVLSRLSPEQQASVIDALDVLLEACREVCPNLEVDPSLQVTAELTFRSRPPG